MAKAKLERKVGKESLKCVLTDDEVREYGIALARATSTITDLESQKKAFNDQIKADISKAEGDANILSQKIQNGYEFRTIDVETVLGYESGIVFTIRMDTGEEIRSRSMTPEERQKGLFEEKD